MIEAVQTYLALRRAAGFSLRKTECLLRSFARFASHRQETADSHGDSNGLGRREPVDRSTA